MKIRHWFVSFKYTCANDKGHRNLELIERREAAKGPITFARIQNWEGVIKETLTKQLGSKPDNLIVLFFKQIGGEK